MQRTYMSLRGVAFLTRLVSAAGHGWWWWGWWDAWGADPTLCEGDCSTSQWADDVGLLQVSHTVTGAAAVADVAADVAASPPGSFVGAHDERLFDDTPNPNLTWQLLSAAGCPAPWTGNAGCHGLPRLHPLGRMLLTEDLASTTAFYERYFGAVREKSIAPWSQPGCTQVVQMTVPGHQQALTLVHDTAKPDPLRPVTTYDVAVENVKELMQWAVRDNSRWTGWEDNHDGYGAPLHTPFFNEADNGTCLLANMSAIDGTAQCYGFLLRGYIPATLHTFEINTESVASHKCIGRETISSGCEPFRKGPDAGRQISVDEIYEDQRLFVFHGWFKATAATSDPLAAATFAARYLGGAHLPSPYPSPKDMWIPGGHYAQWVLLAPTATERPFWLHFVRSPATPGGWPDVSQLAAMTAAGRNLSGGVFDRLLYNAVRFSVEDLAPFVERFLSDDVPFLVRRTSATSGSLFTSIPGSSYAFEIAAERGLPSGPAYQERWNMC